MAKTLNVSRADAYTAVADVWAMLAADAEGDIVKGWTLEMLDAVVEMEMAGCGTAMLQAGLVGIVDDGLVLPAELRNQQRDERGGRAAAAGGGEDERASRRKEQNRQAARHYRKKNRVTGSKAKPSSDKAWRSLGRVAGHEVRVFDGPHGCYAMVLGATVGGEPCRKLTAGNKAWSLESVRLTDTLPALVDKCKTVHQKESKAFEPRPMTPAYADFRDDAERLTMLAKLAAEEARHADAADASSRHADASAIVSKSSADENAESEQNPFDGMGLDAADASANRHADGVSSMSFSSKSSSIEEDMRERGQADSIDMRNRMAARIAKALGEDFAKVQTWLRCNRPYLSLRMKTAGIDLKTGERVAAEGSDEPVDARGDTVVTTEPTTSDKPAAGSVDAQGDDEDFERVRRQLAEQLLKATADAAADIGMVA